MVIYKYDLRPGYVEAPIKKILDVQYQDGVPVMWAIVKPDSRKIRIDVAFVVTGQEIDQEILREYDYMKTLQDGWYVTHVFIKEGD